MSKPIDDSQQNCIQSINDLGNVGKEKFGKINNFKLNSARVSLINLNWIEWKFTNFLSFFI
jgi:hypothetical protein